MTTLSKAYDNPADANDAVYELRANHFDEIELVSNGPTHLVTVEVPVTMVPKAEELLSLHGRGRPAPGADGPKTTAKSDVAAAPVSKTHEVALLAPPPKEMLLAPPSKEITRRTYPADPLAGPRTMSELLGIPELTRNQHGSASLLNNPAPLSSLLHLPVLWSDPPPSAF